MVSLRKLGILCKQNCTIESTYPDVCSVYFPLQETIGLYGGLFKTAGYLRYLLSIYECFDQMRMITFGGDELFKLMYFV